MNILAIVPYVPNLVRVRPYQILRGLVARGHKVTLFTLLSTPDEEPAVRELENLGLRVRAYPLSRSRSYLNCLKAIPGTTPLQAVYCDQAAMAQGVLQASRSGSFDAVHVEHLRGVRNALLLNKTIRHLPIVWDSVDNISHLFRQAVANEKSTPIRFLRALELARTERYEARLCGQLDCITVTSPLDKNAFDQLAAQFDVPRRAKIHVVPNGTDLDYFYPDPTTQRIPQTLVVSGKMSYHANISMVNFLVREVLPLVWREYPATRLLVVGKDPPASIKSFTADPRIVVTGTVPDIRPYLRQAEVAVAPLRYGAGIQNKVLEAMACATPVICSRAAVLPLQAQSEQDLLVAEEAAEFAHQIVRLLRDDALRIKIGAAGRAYVERYHRWDALISRFEKLYAGETP
jgi:sugar transferase (PEP-CTERM/EpsH1 system associated)